MIVTGSVRRSDGRPLGAARVYVYQTSAKGWYSDKAPHVSGMEGDTRHARLFGYMLADPEGKFEFRTVHPTGYPRSDLPAHIHIMVTPAGGSSPGLVSEIRFDDDPRMTEPMKESSRREGYLVCHVTSDPDGTKRVRADFTVP
jgi:protocatechuate 3,4-dioxygenase beta subunit